MADILQTILQVFIGVSLAAVCGYRVFVPLLVMGIAGLAGYMDLADGFQWISSYPAVIVFGVATILEIAAYLVPYVDNLLNAISLPVGVVAGVLVAASVITDMDPVFKWTLAIIAGGGAATLSGLLSNGVHQGSTVVSAGAANPAVSTVESAGTVATSVLSIAVPILSVLFLAVLVIVSVLFFRAVKKRRKGGAPPKDPAGG